METAADSWWLLAFGAKCSDSTPQSYLALVIVFLLTWLATALLYWAHPGGPAWGKYWWRRSRRKMMAEPVPGPRGVPLLGSMTLMMGLAHQRISAAARRCGGERLMAFSLGGTRVIVSCNPDVAKEILNNSVFADRPVKESAYSLMFHRAIGFAPYGVYWRTLRRIAATHLFCPKQISSAEPQRFEIADQMVDAFHCSGPGEIRVREFLKRASLNNMMCSVFGRKYELGSPNEEVQELAGLVEEGYDLLGKLNWADHLPFLTGFDPQRIRYRCSNLVPKVNRLVHRIIKEHRAQPGPKNRDFVDVLLSLQGDDKLSDSDMVAVLWEMIFRGTDTVAVLIEWVLARLALHPDVQESVHRELDRIVGKSRAVTETDVPALKYLQAVVKEVLRLHPPGPLLSWARLAITDTLVDGRQIPAGTTAMVNMWAIARDPEVWSDPESFKPERFVAKKAEAEFSILGSDLRLAPFGSGRRSCPGKALGLATVTFWVASLLHEFEWLESEASPVSLGEVLRLSCEMSSALTVKVRPRRRQTKITKNSTRLTFRIGS
ncbi:cytochrome P450 78A9-like [Aristolochia californica]|uniref:cytochrome P450 78A9-like n=1 Tax=Aristolochia californica TaxID=171875 RepID=UPI0035D82DB5